MLAVPTTNESRGSNQSLYDMNMYSAVSDSYALYLILRFLAECSFPNCGHKSTKPALACPCDLKK